MKFIGREEELKKLNDAFNRPYGSNIVIYGRRRVGKSALIAKASESFNGIIIPFVALEKVAYEQNLSLLTNAISKKLNKPYLHFDDMDSLLLFLFDEAKDKSVLLVLDEFPFLLKNKPELLSLIQEPIDQKQKDSHLNIIFSGSSFGEMRKIIEDPSPLYGRFNEIIHVFPFDYYDMSKWCENLSSDEKFKFYAVFGGIPYYLDNLNFSLSFEENIKRYFLPSGSFFENEVQATSLKEITKDEKTYQTLSLIANGKHSYAKINEVLPGKGDSKAIYSLKKLLDERLIEKLIPINSDTDKKSSYYVLDPLLDFYFNFIDEFQTERTYMNVDDVFELIKEKLYTSFLPRRFEKVAQEFLIRRNKRGLIKPLFRNIGHYSYYDKKGKKNLEFDIVTLDENGYCNYECKYRSTKISKEDVYSEIKEAKERNIPFTKYGFISKSGFKEDIDDSIIMYSLEDFYKE